MKTDRQWLENYRVNPRGDKTVYKNYYNPNQTGAIPMQQQEEQAGMTKGLPQGFTQAQEKMLSVLPKEMQEMNLEEILKQLTQQFSENNPLEYNQQYPNMFNQAQEKHNQQMQNLQNQYLQSQQEKQRQIQLQEEQYRKLQQQNKIQQQYKPPVQIYKAPVNVPQINTREQLIREGWERFVPHQNLMRSGNYGGNWQSVDNMLNQVGLNSQTVLPLTLEKMLQRDFVYRQPNSYGYQKWDPNWN